jgi:hypothetical protein
MQMYKNNQTTSTKCQYQDAASKVKWRELVKWNLYNFIKQVDKKIVPIITWIPWKPVATKKIEPYTESEIQKIDSEYSKDCKNVNINPNTIVIIKLIILWFLFLWIKLWWDQVMLTPEDNRIIVLSKGIEKGFKVITPKGGQLIPISTAGERLEWKNAQKNEKKNNTSDVINNKKPIFNPVNTILVWSPSKLDS